MVLRFLESVGRRAEADFYLQLFRSAAPERFACIAVDSALLAAAGDAVALDLALLRGLGLFPVVLVGTLTPDLRGIQAARLQRALARQGVAAAVLPTPAAAPVLATAAAGKLAIVSMRAGQGTSLADRLEHLSRLALGLRTRKVVVLDPRGALRPGGRRLPLVNLSRDTEALVAEPSLTAEQRQLLRWAQALVCARAESGLTVALTSPFDLMRELFTLGGAGTLLRRGAEVVQHGSWDGVSAPRLGQLLAAAFGRAVAGDLFARPLDQLLLEVDYRGAALLQATPLGTYLSKFAVEPEAQGEGVGHDLWLAVGTASPRLFWRSSPQNPINAWYDRQCDGLHRDADWHVYWRGLRPDAIPAVVAYALAQPRDFSSPDREASP